MSLKNLTLENFRNFKSVSVDISPGINVLYGENGAGKTNFLEAIYYLATGRSFRCNSLSRLISYNAHHFIVRCLLSFGDTFVNAGVQRLANGEHQIRINESSVASFSELARFLPVLFFNQDAYHLLTGGPKSRRQFLDWGVFHVEGAPISLWRRFNSALLQRNAALKSAQTISSLRHWDQAFVATGLELVRAREIYWARFLPVLQDFMRLLLPDFVVDISYCRGWSTDADLLVALEASLKRDLDYKFTRIGPHRADIKWMVDGVLPQDILSRGQQKIFLLAAYLAKASLLAESKSSGSIFLIDDLTAELDRQKQSLAVAHIQEMDAQVFVTGIEGRDFALGLSATATRDACLFHVKQGLVSIENF